MTKYDLALLLFSPLLWLLIHLFLSSAAGSVDEYEAARYEDFFRFFAFIILVTLWGVYILMRK